MPSGKTYDLHLRSGSRWFSSDHGVTLTDEAIAWSDGEQKRAAPLADIAEIHLQTGRVGDNTIASCRMTFRDGKTLLIASNNKLGLQDDAHDKLYTAFVSDLHGRLAALRGGLPAFTSGFGKTRYRFGLAVAVFAGLFLVVTPIVVLLITSAWSMVWTLFVGAGLVWPVYRLVRANAPRSYDPRVIPPGMLPAGPGA